MYEFMHVCMNVHVCISLRMLVCMHVCVCLANDCINVKTETKVYLLCTRKFLLFTSKLDFYSDCKFYRGSCLICLIRTCSYGTTGYLSQCYNSSKKIMYDPWNSGGLNPSLFVIWGV